MMYNRILLKRCLEHYIDFVIQLYTYNCEKDITYFAKKLEGCIDNKTFREIYEIAVYIDSLKDCMFKYMYVNELKTDLIYEDIIENIIRTTTKNYL